MNGMSLAMSANSAVDDFSNGTRGPGWQRKLGIGKILSRGESTPRDRSPGVNDLMTTRMSIGFQKLQQRFQVTLTDNGVTKSNTVTVNDAGTSGARRLI
jgi:hypothetical protein